MRTIIAKTSKGATTHNGDGRYRRCWRLWSDGVVERTSSRSKYQPPFRDETVPPVIRAAAEERGVFLRGFRERQPGQAAFYPYWRSSPPMPSRRLDP